MVILFFLSLAIHFSQVKAQKISSFPVYSPQRTDQFIIYRPSGTPVSNMRYSIDSIFSLLTVADITDLETYWFPNGTAIYYSLGKVGIGEVAPLANLHLGNASGTPGYGTAANGLQIGGNPLGYFNIYQNTSNQLVFGRGGTNIWYMNNTGILPATNSTYNLGSPSLYWNNIYGRNYFVNDTTLSDWVAERIEESTLTLGTINQIPFMNGTTDFQYSNNFKWNDKTLSLSDNEDSLNIYIGNLAGEYAIGQRNVYIGESSGYTGSGGSPLASYNVFVGAGSGSTHANGNNNVFLGYESGSDVNSGTGNIFIGYKSGRDLVSSDNKLYIENSNSSSPLIYGNFADDSLIVNGTFKAGSGLIWNDTTLFVGNSSYNMSIAPFINEGIYYNINTGTHNTVINNGLSSNTTGDWNTAIGDGVLYDNTTGDYNTAVGGYSLLENETGNNNTAIGYNSGLNSVGSGNIFLGYQAGYNETGSNKLYIENSNSTTPLIWGDFANDTVRINGKLDVTSDFFNEAPHLPIYRITDTTIAATQNVWYKIGGFTQKFAPVGMTVQGDSVRLDKKGHFNIDFTISFSGLNNEIWEIAVFKNNAQEHPSQLRYTSTSDVGNMSCPVEIVSDGDDWVSFRIRNTTDNDDPTIKRFSAIIKTEHLMK